MFHVAVQINDKISEKNKKMGSLNDVHDWDSTAFDELAEEINEKEIEKVCYLFEIIT